MLAEQLSISRELTQKIRPVDDSDEEEDEENESPLVLSSSDKDNPWMNSTKSKSEIDEFVECYRKYHDEKKKRAEETKVTAEVDHESKSASTTNERKLDDKLQEEISDVSNEAGTYFIRSIEFIK